VLERTAAATDAGKRLDHYLKEQFPEHSRALLQEWIKAGRVTVNGGKAKASLVLRGSERIVLEPAERPPLHAHAEDLPIEILYQDAAMLAVNKPAGMVVHAGAGVHSGTLVNALLHHATALSTGSAPLRPGIVHRLDKETSGVILIARNDAAHQHLAEQFASRKVEKVYLAMVHGSMEAEAGRIDKPIARDPERRTRMTARLAAGRSALTMWRVLRRFDKYSYLEVKIGTGRTHQIRVHLSSIRHAVVGDRLYGAPPQPALGARFFLHAARIGVVSPATGKPVIIEAPLAPELQQWMDGL
jgi:23S rRNA pseudouridine1911/1915/1917 synthase